MFWREICCADCLPSPPPAVDGSGSRGSYAFVEFDSEVLATADRTEESIWMEAGSYLIWGRLIQAIPYLGDGDYLWQWWTEL